MRTDPPSESTTPHSQPMKCNALDTSEMLTPSELAQLQRDEIAAEAYQQTIYPHLRFTSGLTP